MRWLGALAACVAVLVTAACDRVSEQYFREGVGSDLSYSQLAQATQLEREYVYYICRQADNPIEETPAGPSCVVRNWTAFTWAGMNDIDRRCDAYLSWLDAQRRNRAPVLNEIAAIGGTAGAIMGVAGAGTEALAIAAAAFGLASTTYSNWNSRLLLDVEHSTVQTLVYTRQQQFRLVNVGLVVPDSASAIYLLRGYLRICMPITIETDINTSVTLMQRGAPQSVLETSVVRPFILPPATARVFRESIPSSPRAPLPGAAGQPGGPKPEPTIEQARGEVEPGMPISLGRQIQGNLCVSVPDGNFGADTREAIRQAKLAANMSRVDKAAPPLFRSVNEQIDTKKEAQIFLDAKHCEVDRSGIDRAYATAFEKFRFADENAIKDLQKALAHCDPNVKQTGMFDKATRNGISAATGRTGSPVAKTDRLNDKSYEWVLGVCS